MNPFPRVRRTLAAWQGTSIRQRIERFAIGFALLFLLLAGVSSYLVTQRLAQRAAEDNLEYALSLFAQHFELHLGETTRDLTNLSSNRLLGSALVDSMGREVYLAPFLSGYGAIAKTHHQVGLCLDDAHGAVLACVRDGARIDLSRSPWLEKVMAQGQAQAEMLQVDGRPLLQLLIPVVLAGSGTVEGVIATRIDLNTLFLSAAGPDGAHFDKRLLLDGQPLLRARGTAGKEANLLLRSRMLDLPPPLAALRLSTSIAEPRRQALRHAYQLALWHAALAALLIPLAVLLARAAARRLTGCLSRLSSAVDHVTQSGELAIDPGPQGADEVGTLARSFSQMLARLKDAQDHLERRVEERTQALARSESRLREAQHIAGLGSWEYDFRNDSNTWSDEVYTIFGIDKSHTQLSYAAYLARVHPEDRERVAQTFQEALRAHTALDRVYRIVMDDGAIKYIQGRGSFHYDADGQAVMAIGTVLDITHQKETEERLRQAAAVYEYMADGVMVTRPDATILAVNKAFTSITGFAESEALGATPRLMRSGRHNSAFYDGLWHAMRTTGAWQGEIWNRRKNGEIFPCWMSIATVYDSDGEIANYVSVFSDISRIKESEHQLRHLAHYDPLTNLPNRVLFRLRLEHTLDQARRRGSRFALLFIDLDRFKQVNDALGHIAGDELLVALTERVKQRVRQEDTFARLGGDEFILLLEHLENAEDAAILAHEVISQASLPFRLSDGNEVEVGASIGISIYPDHGDDASQLLHNADIAMYEAKDAGRNAFRFYAAQSKPSQDAGDAGDAVS
jgi:diguanylate cyclase (GGDEF)-like protein/PAS domain S-box-containing protein